MNKISIITMAALLSGGLATATYAVQGQTDTGGASGQASPSTPNMGSGSSQDTDTNASGSQRSKKSKSTSKERGMTPDNKRAPAPPVPQEGSNPSLDPTGKGSTSGG